MGRVDTTKLSGIVAGYHKHLSATRSHNTADTYVRSVLHFLEYLNRCNIKLANIDLHILTRYSEWMAQSYAPRSVHTIVYAVEHWLNWLSEQGFTVPSWKKPDLPKIQASAHVWLEPAEVSKMLELLSAWIEPRRTVLVMLLGCGARVTELCELRLSDLHILEGGRVIVQLHGKGDKYRDAPLLDFAKPYLSNYLRTVHPGPQSQWLFPSKSWRKPLASRTVESWTQHLSKQFGKRIFPHAMRHTYISALHAAGVDNLTLSKIAGHNNLSTTAIYTHLSGDSLNDAASRADNYLNDEED